MADVDDAAERDRKTALSIVGGGGSILLPFVPGKMGDNVEVSFERKQLYDLIVAALSAVRAEVGD